MNNLRRVQSIAMFLMILLVGFTFSLLPGYAQDPPADPEYPYADGGLTIDDSDKEPCFSIVSGTWEKNQAGYKHTSLYSIIEKTYYNQVKWIPDYKKLQGSIEVFTSIPPMPPEDKYELSEEVDYCLPFAHF